MFAGYFAYLLSNGRVEKTSMGLERGIDQRSLMGLPWLMGDQDPGFSSASPTSALWKDLGALLHGQKYLFLLD